MMTIGEFRELTSDVPGDWPMLYTVLGGDDMALNPADATVDLTGRAVLIMDDSHVTRAGQQ